MHRPDATPRGRPPVWGLPLLFLCLAALPQDALQQGRKLLRESRFQQALEEVARFKQSAPKDPRGHHLAGLILASAGRHREAASEFAAAVALDPDNLDYRLAAAVSLARVEQTESALQMLEPYDGGRLVEQNNLLLLGLLAELHEKRQQNAEALAALERLSQIQPEDPRLDVRIGRIHLVEGRFQEAAAAFGRATGKQPDSAAALQGLGLALGRLDKSDEAVAALTRAVDLAPTNPSYLLDLGKALLERGENSQALELFTRAAARPDAPPEVYYELARAQRRAGDSEKARMNLEKFREIDQRRQSRRVAARRLEGLLKTAQDRLREGRVREARDAFAEAVEIDPDNWAAHSFLAKIYMSSNLLAQAAPHLDALQRIDSESAEGNFLRASYLYREGQFEQALAPALEAKEKRPDYGELRNLLGNIYFSMGRRAEAEAEYAAAVGLEPDREDFRRNYEAARGGDGIRRFF